MDERFPFPEPLPQDFSDSFDDVHWQLMYWGQFITPLDDVLQAAKGFVRDITARHPDGADAACAAEYAKKMILAASAHMFYDRAFAVLVRDMLAQPAWTKWDPNGMFKDALCSTVERAFYACFRGVCATLT